MKKFLFILLLSLSNFIANAQVQWFRSTQYASASVNTYTGKYTWGDWQSSNVKISIDTDNDIITIYSPVTQRYVIIESYNNGNYYTDTNGGSTVKYTAVDKDGDVCEIRLRIDRNGSSQLYIDFSNVAWVYTIIRI